MARYEHTAEPSLYAYRKGCRCAGCKAKNADAKNRYNARAAVKRRAAEPEPVPAEGAVEKSVRDQLAGLVEIPWQETWKLLALQHARTLDVIAVTGQHHLAGTAHAKLAECLDRLRPPAPAAGQAVRQGITDLESFANDL